MVMALLLEMKLDEQFAFNHPLYHLTVILNFMITDLNKSQKESLLTLSVLLLLWAHS